MRYSTIIIILVVLVFGISCSSENSGRTQNTEGSVEGQTNAVNIKLTEVTQEAGLGDYYHETGAFGNKWMPETFSGGGGFIDYNGDGWEDILLMGGGAWTEYSDVTAQPIWLYRNNGDGTFTEVTEEAGLADVSTYSFGLTVADYDNDGDQDFFATNLYENLLFRNDNGVFTEVGTSAGVTNQSTLTTAAMFIDVDRDGDLDLYVGNYVDWTPENDRFCTFDGVTKTYCTPILFDGVDPEFYINNGDGTFTDVTEEYGFLPSPGKTLGVTELDFNHDGWPDIFVANDTERNCLYENNGDGTYTEKALLYGVAYSETGKARAGMGVDAGIVDQTGEPTIFIGHFSSEMTGVFRHTDNGYFSERSAPSNIGQLSYRILTFGINLIDFDMDTDLDVFNANGHIQKLMQDSSNYRQRPTIFTNNGDGTFIDQTEEIGGPLLNPIVGRSSSYADYDKDGDPDLLVTESGGPVHLFRNDIPQGTFFRVRLLGNSSNRDGVGSTVRVYADSVMMERRVRTGTSYLSNSEKPVNFGMGNATTIDSVVVTWPSGTVNRFYDLPVNQMIQVTEGAQNYITESLPGFIKSDMAGL